MSRRDDLEAAMNAAHVTWQRTLAHCERGRAPLSEELAAYQRYVAADAAFNQLLERTDRVERRKSRHHHLRTWGYKRMAWRVFLYPRRRAQEAA